MIFTRLGKLTLTIIVATGILAATSDASAKSSNSSSQSKPAPLACAGPTVHKADGSNWICTFDDEFNGRVLDTSKWSPVTTANTGLMGGAGCFVDSPDNVSTSGGMLNLTARKESEPFACRTSSGNVSTSYSAGQVATSGKFSQTHGRFSVRAKFPAATVAGLHSALWMWPQNYFTTGQLGEIDVAEEYSVLADRVVPYLHYSYDPSTVNAATNTNVFTNNYCLVADVNAFHEYTVEWTPDTFTILYDGQTCVTDNLQVLGVSPFDQPYFMLLTQSLDTGFNNFDPATTPLPATTQVDWVRAWK